MDLTIIIVVIIICATFLIYKLISLRYDYNEGVEKGSCHSAWILVDEFLDRYKEYDKDNNTYICNATPKDMYILLLKLIRILY